ncbi:PAX-interacting protein 1 [Halocaridina rubra]|uniref:PAX-interacting protein 1 n=1 Tax=Halocaridina rubra TaxID=373956 RepID=A0AAN8ZSA1_HALRR
MSPHGRPIPGRPLPQGFTAVQPGGVVSPGQGSPHMVAGGQLTPQQQLTPHVSPLASPHGHSPIQRGDGTVIAHASVMQGSPGVPPNLVTQQNLASHHKTKTALAMHVTSRLAGGVHQGGVLPPGPQVPMDIATHVVQKQPALPQETVQGPGGEPVMMFQRRALGNITGTVTNNILRPPSQGTPTPAVASGHGYPRAAPPSHSSSGGTPVLAPSAPHYPRPHLVGHDTNIMLPRELCLVGCVFYIADYHGDVTLQTLQTWKILIQQHGGEVVPLYDTARVTHLLCKHQKSPVFMQAVRENKRCITVYWLNDVLLRGKMAPPWQAVHLPTPFGDDMKPCKDLIVSITGFEKEERSIITLMLRLVGATYTGCFSRHNHLLVCKKLEGAKVAKAKEWRKPVVNGVWLSEVLLGQNTPPLVYHGTRYQHYLDDPLRIDPSLASHLVNAWKYPISVSKESVEKAKAGREIALRKRKSEVDADQENKRSRVEPPSVPHLGSLSTPAPPQIGGPSHGQNSSNGVHPGSTGSQQSNAAGYNRGPLTVINKELPPEQQRPRILLSFIKNKEEVERKILELGGYLARTSVEATHLVMGGNIAHRTVKLMCAISCSSFIVSLQWILDSHCEAKFLHEQNYTLEMPEYERIFQFCLRDTLAKPNRRHLFAGRTFYLTPSVVPGRTWLKEIIEFAGGSVDSKLRSVKDVKERHRDGTYQYMIIAAQEDSHLVRDFLKEDLPVYFAEFVLGAILRQQIDTSIAKYMEED